jgi:hypothetical protein
MNTRPDLRASLEGLYRVFSIYPLSEYTDPCLHCHSIDDEAKLHSLPLRQLGIAELRDYAADALSVWGGVNDFKHFLPRIFELFVNSADPSLDLIDSEILFSKFRHGKWQSWPQAEQIAIKSFLHALWTEVLNDPPDTGSFMDIESWLCTIAQAEDDLSPYLSQWIEDSRSSASFALSSMLLGTGIAESSSTSRNAFWEGRDEQYVQVQNWTRTLPVIQKLKQALDTCDTPTCSSEFEAALGVLEAARQ